MCHVLHECSAPGLSGQVASLDLIDLPVTGHGQTRDGAFGFRGHLGEFGIGTRRQIHGLQLVQGAMQIGNQFDRTRGRRVGADVSLGIEHDLTPPW